MATEKSDRSAGLNPERVMSVDFFRGFTMFMLIGEFTGLFYFLGSEEIFGTGIFHSFALQLEHHPWNGLRFWDLIQPFFMFIVGVAIPFSVANRRAKGESSSLILKHAVKRSVLLLIIGWALYCIGPGKITFQFQNVLAQLSVTYLAAFLLMNLGNVTQIIITLGILLAMDLAYRFFPVEGFNHAFVPDQNLGAWFDMKINGELSEGHWVSLNAISTIAHTVWGVLAGKLLMSDKTQKEKMNTLWIAGVVLLVAGYALNPLTPIIKRIATSSFVLASGGWSVLALCFSFWLIDVKKYRKLLLFFAVVGMNPLFIYLFAHIGGSNLVSSIFIPYSNALFNDAHQYLANMLTAVLTWGVLWYICYWLYRNRIFIKL
jgi:predicted acyltransferase